MLRRIVMSFIIAVLLAVSLFLGTGAARIGGPTCLNGIRDGDESDVDCGGVGCPACAPGWRCRRDQDCGSGHCLRRRCVAFPPRPIVDGGPALPWDAGALDEGPPLLPGR